MLLYFHDSLLFFADEPKLVALHPNLRFLHCVHAAIFMNYCFSSLTNQNWWPCTHACAFFIAFMLLSP